MSFHGDFRKAYLILAFDMSSNVCVIYCYSRKIILQRPFYRFCSVFLVLYKFSGKFMHYENYSI